jgi:hypothetical protein
MTITGISVRFSHDVQGGLGGVQPLVCASEFAGEPRDLGPAFSRFSRLSSADSSVVVPGREPESTCAWRTHLRTVSAVPTPSRRATSLIAAHSESC